MNATAEMTWEQHQAWEADWWGDCTNTFGEETKQITYAHRMGLVNTPIWEHWPIYDLAGKSVLDLGGGPVSMLLKTVNGDRRTVVDPCRYPAWVSARYASVGITYVRQAAEDFAGGGGGYDEVWIYNVLQHVRDPAAVIETARGSGKMLRMFEWLNVPACPGHPHELHADDLNDILGGVGGTEQLNENGCYGLAYFGTFAL